MIPIIIAIIPISLLASLEVTSGTLRSDLYFFTADHDNTVAIEVIIAKSAELTAVLPVLSSPSEIVKMKLDKDKANAMTQSILIV